MILKEVGAAYNPDIWLEILRKPRKISAKIAGFRVDIWTRYLQNNVLIEWLCTVTKSLVTGSISIILNTATELHQEETEFDSYPITLFPW
jgi:hypothetical protein